jgi:hypothetical protein
LYLIPTSQGKAEALYPSGCIQLPCLTIFSSMASICCSVKPSSSTLRSTPLSVRIHDHTLVTKWSPNCISQPQPNLQHSTIKKNAFTELAKQGVRAKLTVASPNARPYTAALPNQNRQRWVQSLQVRIVPLNETPATPNKNSTSCTK